MEEHQARAIMTHTSKVPQQKQEQNKILDDNIAVM